MARPRKKQHDIRNKQLAPVRCTEQECACIKAQAEAAKMGVSTYLREAAIKGGVQVPEESWGALVQQLKKVGVNINQQTKKMHQLHSVPPELYALWGKLSQLLDQIIIQNKK